jgi:hypothetical protein
MYIQKKNGLLLNHHNMQHGVSGRKFGLAAESGALPYNNSICNYWDLSSSSRKVAYVRLLFSVVTIAMALAASRRQDLRVRPDRRDHLDRQDPQARRVLKGFKDNKGRWGRKVLQVLGARSVLQGHRGQSDHRARRAKGAARDPQGQPASGASQVRKVHLDLRGLRDQQALQENRTSPGHTGL